MGRLAPWAKYRKEWEEIRDERKKGGSILERKTSSSSSSPSSGDSITNLIPDPSSPPEVEQRYKWMPQLLSASLGLSRVRFYSEQGRCPLFRLPVELRLAIWEYAVGGGEITVVRKVDKLAHVVLPRDQERLDAAYAAGRASWQPVGSERRVRADQVLADVNLLAMLQSCKRLYIEALPVLYGCNAFEFRTMESFHRFLARAPAAGLRAVRSVRVAWNGFGYWQYYERRVPEAEMELDLELDESWREICGAVLAMRGLRDLSLRSWRAFDLRPHQRTTTRAEMVRRILAPLDGLPEQVNLSFTVQSGDDVYNYTR